MNPHATLTRTHQRILFALLGLAVFAPVLVQASASLPWMPAWLGAAVALAAVFSAFAVFWRAGALRTRYVVLLVLALAIAAAIGTRAGGLM